MAHFELISSRVAQPELSPLLLADTRFAGFSITSRGRHVRLRPAGGFDLIYLGALKGADFALQWGLSLPYVPERWWTEAVRWHRNDENAQFDLFEWPQRDGARVFLISGRGGLSEFRNGLEPAWQDLRDEIAAWFARAATDEGALEITGEVYRGPAWPMPPRLLVRAFIYAHLNRGDEACAALDELRRRSADDDTPALRKALARVLSRGAAG